MTTNTLNPTHDPQVLAKTSDWHNKLSIPEMKKRVLEKDVLDDLLCIAKTGHRRVFEKDDEKGYVEIHERVPAKEHIAVLKLLIDKVLPTCRDVTEPDEGYAKWQEFTEAKTSPVSELSPDQRQAQADAARVNAIASAKVDCEPGQVVVGGIDPQPQANQNNPAVTAAKGGTGGNPGTEMRGEAP